MNKTLGKTIMRVSQLRNKFLKIKTRNIKEHIKIIEDVV